MSASVPMSPFNPAVSPVAASPKSMASEGALSCANINRQVRGGRFWFYVLILIIAIVISWYLMLARKNDGTFNSLNTSWIVPPVEVYMLGSALILIIAAYVTYAIDQVADQRHRNWINLAFFLVVIFFVIWAIIAFGQLNLRLALIFSILTLLATLWMAYLVWKVATDLMIPAVIVVIGAIILVCSNISLMNNNP